MEEYVRVQLNFEMQSLKKLFTLSGVCDTMLHVWTDNEDDNDASDLVMYCACVKSLVQ